MTFDKCPLCGSKDIGASLSDGNTSASCECGLELHYSTKTNETNHDRLKNLIDKWNTRI